MGAEGGGSRPARPITTQEGLPSVPGGDDIRKYFTGAGEYNRLVCSGEKQLFKLHMFPDAWPALPTSSGVGLPLEVYVNHSLSFL